MGETGNMSKQEGNLKAAGTFLQDLDSRSREIFRSIVEGYLETGEALGSKVLSQTLKEGVSPATVRNVMAELERMGLVYAPHTSAGRLPTNSGMRFFVDSFLEIGDLAGEDRKSIDAQVRASGQGRTLDTVLTEASQLLSGLTRNASLVTTAKQDLRLKQIEFVQLEAKRALVVIVGDNGQVENRILNLPEGATASVLREASNFLNAHIAGKTLTEARQRILQLHNAARSELDTLAQNLVDEGLAIWGGGDQTENARLIVSGHANLLEDLKAADDIDRIRQLFEELEARESMMKLLDLAESGESVRIFIGSESRLYSASGSSLIVSPYRDKNQNVIGALGIIGPTRLNYARIVPMVDYTAKVVSRILQK